MVNRVQVWLTRRVTHGLRPCGLSGFCFGSEGLYGLAGDGDHHEEIYLGY